MTGLIEEIQRGALDSAIPVDALLRRVKLAAAKLGLPPLESWVNQELNGYSGPTGDLPEYRTLHGEPAAWNPYNGWIPVQVADEKLAELLSTAWVGQSCASLQDLLSRETSGHLHFPIPMGLVLELNKVMNFKTARMVVQIGRGNLVGILDTVRNSILDWAIEMEKSGVVGEGLSFNAQEREQAREAMTTIHIGSIGNMAGHIGTGNEGDVRATQTTNEAAVFQSMAEAVRAGVSKAEDRERLIAAIASMEGARGDKASFGAAYASFIATAADYMSLISPFLPAIALILAG